MLNIIRLLLAENIIHISLQIEEINIIHSDSFRMVVTTKFSNKDLDCISWNYVASPFTFL